MGLWWIGSLVIVTGSTLGTLGGIGVAVLAILRGDMVTCAVAALVALIALVMFIDAQWRMGVRECGLDKDSGGKDWLAKGQRSRIV